MVGHGFESHLRLSSGPRRLLAGSGRSGVLVLESAAMKTPLRAARRGRRRFRGVVGRGGPAALAQTPVDPSATPVENESATAPINPFGIACLHRRAPAVAGAGDGAGPDRSCTCATRLGSRRTRNPSRWCAPTGCGSGRNSRAATSTCRRPPRSSWRRPPCPAPRRRGARAPPLPPRAPAAAALPQPPAASAPAAPAAAAAPAPPTAAAARPPPPAAPAERVEVTMDQAVFDETLAGAARRRHRPPDRRGQGPPRRHDRGQKKAAGEG